MPDSVSRLINDVLSLIDSMEVKDTTRVEMLVDSTRITKDTIIVTTDFVEDTLIARQLQSVLDSVVGVKTLKKDTLSIQHPDSNFVVQTKDSIRKIPPKPQPLKMCAQAQALINESRRQIPILSFGTPVNPIFLPIVFDGQRPEKKPGLYSQNNNQESSIKVLLPIPQTIIDEDLSFSELGEYAQACAILEHPEKIHYTPERLPKAIRVERMKKRREFLSVKGPRGPKEFNVRGRELKLKHWISNLQSALQVSQTYVSDNWYQGGTSNLNLISTQAYSLKYNDYKDKMLFENKIQWNINISSAPDDTLRRYSISEDLFRIDSKVGYKAFQNFYYTSSFYFKTQFFKNYKKNTDTRTASFLSSGELSYNLGLSHNYTSKNKSFSSTASLSPFSYNLKTCIDEEIDPTKFGIEEGEKVLHKFGSSFDASLKWEFMRNMYIASRIYYFTSYEHVQIDFENTFNFVLNRYFSTQIEFKMRYDDSVEPNEKGSFLQIKEILSFGLFFRI